MMYLKNPVADAVAPATHAGAGLEPVLQPDGVNAEPEPGGPNLAWSQFYQEPAMPAAATTTSPTRSVPQGMGYLLTVPSSGECAQHPRYWPSDLLYSFTLQMAARGFCVSASMMLGDRQYALEQLAQAHTLNDDDLRAMAVKLFTYFDAPPCLSHARLN